METIFMNTENSKTNEPHKFKLDLADKRNLRNPKKNIALVNLSIYSHGKTLNLSTTKINLKYQLQLGMKLLICLMVHILLMIYNIDEFIIKKHETLTDNSPIQIYANKIKNRIVFKIKNDRIINP